MLKNALLLFLLVGHALCKPLHKRWDDLKVKHAWANGVPNGWEVVGPAPAEEKLAVRIGLKQDGIDDLISHLYAVSDPSHHRYGTCLRGRVVVSSILCCLRYGQHLTKEQVDALSAPHPDATGLVEDWLSHYDLLHNPECQMTRSSSGDWVTLFISVGQLEQMLGTKYHIYKHSTTEVTLIRTTSYSLPTILHDHVTVVTPSTYFSLPKPQRKTSFIQYVEQDLSDDINSATDIVTSGGLGTYPLPVSPTCNSKITPSCLMALYNISYTPVSTKNNSLGIVGYLNEYANHADLQVRRGQL